MKSIVCKKCKGSGKQIDWLATVFSFGFLALAGENTERCNMCDGRGYYLVKKDSI